MEALNFFAISQYSTLCLFYICFSVCIIFIVHICNNIRSFRYGIAEVLILSLRDLKKTITPEFIYTFLIFIMLVKCVGGPLIFLLPYIGSYIKQILILYGILEVLHCDDLPEVENTSLSSGG